jgi:hypothetical protein
MWSGRPRPLPLTLVLIPHVARTDPANPVEERRLSAPLSLLELAGA